MEKTEPYDDEIDQLLAVLTPDRIAEIDFDHVRELLGHHRETAARLAETLRVLAAVRGDYEVLRQEYISRIGGMVKAMAAVTRAHERNCRGEAFRFALDYVRSLESKGAAELIEHYRLTAARFREAFPGSFALGGGGSNAIPRG